MKSTSSSDTEFIPDNGNSLGEYRDDFNSQNDCKRCENNYNINYISKLLLLKNGYNVS